jgi:hypothetical protein
MKLQSQILTIKSLNKTYLLNKTMIVYLSNQTIIGITLKWWISIKIQSQVLTSLKEFEHNISIEQNYDRVLWKDMR